MGVIVKRRRQPPVVTTTRQPQYPTFYDGVGPGMVTRRVIATPPEIYRSEVTLNTNWTAQITGRQFMVRSDFPVEVWIEGELVTDVHTSSAPEVVYFHYGATTAKTMTLKFPLGRGGAVSGSFTDHNLVQNELLGMHGTFEMRASNLGEPWPQPPIIDQLPTAVYDFKTAGTGTGAKIGFWISQTLTATDWKLGQSQSQPAGSKILPVEFWVKWSYLSAEQTATIEPPTQATEVPYEILYTQSGGPAGDIVNWLNIQGGVTKGSQSARQSVSNIVGDFKVPIRSRMSPWGAETPTTLATVFGPGGGTEDLTIHHRIGVAYLL